MVRKVIDLIVEHRRRILIHAWFIGGAFSCVLYQSMNTYYIFSHWYITLCSFSLWFGGLLSAELVIFRYYLHKETALMKTRTFEYEINKNLRYVINSAGTIGMNNRMARYTYQQLPYYFLISVHGKRDGKFEKIKTHFTCVVVPNTNFSEKEYKEFRKTGEPSDRFQNILAMCVKKVHKKEIELFANHSGEDDWKKIAKNI